MSMWDDHAEEFQSQEIRCCKRGDGSWHIFTMPGSTLEHSVYSKGLLEGVDTVKASIKQLHRSRENIQADFNVKEDQRVGEVWESNGKEEYRSRGSRGEVRKT